MQERATNNGYLPVRTIRGASKLFPWAKAHIYVKTSAGMNLHTQLDLHANPHIIGRVSTANVNERHFLDDLMFEPDILHIMDRGYMAIRRLKKNGTAKS